MTDRTVHAAYPGMEIVRYDRAGKWYFEPLDQSLPRQHITLGGAVRGALWGLEHGGRVYIGRPGGKAFDARFRRAPS